MSKPRMLIIDGSSMLATNYYATIPNEIKFAKTDEEKEKHYDKILQAPDGTYTNAIMGMCRMIANIVEEGDFDRIVTAFDKSRKTTFRRQMYPGYKAQRSATPEPLKQQMILIQQILADSGFPVLLSDEYEADDLAGSVAEKYKQEYQVSLLTKDRDYLQLVDDQNKVTCLIMADYDKSVAFRQRYGYPEPEEKYLKTIMEFNAAAVLGEKGVQPSQIPDLKSLEGDMSDNIPGVKGVSGMTAAVLLTHYESTENLYEELDKVGDNKAALDQIVSAWKTNLGLRRSPLKALVAGRESAIMSKKLATIVRNVPVPDMTNYTLNPDAFQAWMDKLFIRNVSLKPDGITSDPDEEWSFHVGGKKELGIYFAQDEEGDECPIPVEFLLGLEPAAAPEPVSKEPVATDKTVACTDKDLYNKDDKTEVTIGEKNNVEDVNPQQAIEELHKKVQSLTTVTSLPELNNSFEQASELLIKLFDKGYKKIKGKN